MEMGTGKTKVAIDEIGILNDSGEINGALILAPKGVYTNWPNIEIPIHMPMDIPKKMMIWDGFKSARSQREFKYLLQCKELGILVMNIEAFSNGGSRNRAYLHAMEFLRTRDVAMYVDESTLIKNPKANRTKSIVELGTYAKRRRILTGSPVPRSPLDFFSQFQFLRPGLLGTNNFYAFRARYTIMRKMTLRDRTIDVVESYVNLDDLKERVAKHSFRVTKDECLDLPPKVYESRNVEMTAEQKRLYNELKEASFAELDNGFVSTTEVITMILRLHQISCGHVTNADGEMVSIKSNRLSVMEDTLEETDGKVIIWAKYRQDIRMICESLGKIYGQNSFVQYHGGVGTKDRKIAVDRFQNDDECRFFVANTQTGGYGITLTAASTVMYYSNDFDLEKRLQSEDRAHRSGQTKTVTYVDLISPGTVDEKILNALRSKKTLADYVTGDKAKAFLT